MPVVYIRLQSGVQLADWDGLVAVSGQALTASIRGKRFQSNQGSLEALMPPIRENPTALTTTEQAVARLHIGLLRQASHSLSKTFTVRGSTLLRCLTGDSALDSQGA